MPSFRTLGLQAGEHVRFHDRHKAANASLICETIRRAILMRPRTEAPSPFSAAHVAPSDVGIDLRPEAFAGGPIVCGELQDGA